MRYRMQQKVFSFGDDFEITDERGRPVAHVDGKVFSVGDQLTFNDMSGKELARIRQTVLAWGPTYEITRSGELVAVVKKHLFTLFGCRFTVDVPGPNDLEARGNFTDHEYTFVRGDRTVASVSKAWFRMTDSYGVDVADGEDDVLLLASTVVIDMCCHADK